MTDIVQLAARELEKLSRAVPVGKHIVTGDIRRLGFTGRPGLRI